MRGERQRHWRLDRLPRRCVDRVEDVVIWMLISLSLLTVVLAAMVAARRYGGEMHRVDIETRERTQVQAVLLEPSRKLLVADDRAQVMQQIPTLVPVRYTAPDGTARQADTLVIGGRPAGTTVPVWVDRSGMITRSPIRWLDALQHAGLDAAGVLALGAVVLGGIWSGFRAWVRRLTMARWEREWEQVEPQWSGRAR
jgi:hypothetical protein